eukprot:Skav230990  [mRNA]  locus=scaffold1822:56846:59598:- [translate_table: standard]
MHGLELQQLLTGGTAGMFGEFAKLPIDNLQLMIAFLRNDLQSLAKCASTSRCLKVETQRLLRRTWHCRACGVELLHRRRCNPLEHGNFEDGPALMAPYEDTCESFDGRFEAFDFRSCEESPWDSPISSLLQSFPDHTTICHSHFVYCKDCERFLGTRAQITCEREGQTAPDLDVLLLCVPYLLEFDGEGVVEKIEAPYHDVIFHCSGSGHACDAKLFRYDSILSKHHTWRKPGSRAERAWYINSFWNETTTATTASETSIIVGDPESVHLAQGMMETAPVWCSSCKSMIGWKFVKDLSSKKPNVHYVQRFGVCESAILELKKSDSESVDSDESSLLTMGSLERWEELSAREMDDVDDVDESERGLSEDGEAQ